MTKLDSEEKTSLNYLVGTVALGAVLLTAHLVHKLHNDYVSESGAIILLGLVVGGICKLSDYLGNDGHAYMTEMVRFNHSTFLNVILPLIIFEAGYSIKHTGVMRNIGAVLLFALIGTVVSTIIIGAIVFYWSQSAEPDLYNLNSETIDGAGHAGSGLFLALSFGALLSATDPVSVIALLGSRFDMSREPPLLYNLIFGESVLNDAVSIVLFEAFKQYIEKPATAESMALAALVFCKIFVLSSVIGYVFGILTAVFFKYVNLSELPHIEVSIMLLFAAASYYLNDVLELSGIMGVFVTARIIGHHGAYNMSRTSRETAPFVFKTLAALAESAVFFLLGAALWAYWTPWNWYLCAVTVIACLISRAFVVFPLAAISNLTRSTEVITARMQGFMWYSGLRGAIAFGLVVVLRGESPPGTPLQRVADHLLNAVLFTVLFTVLIMGGFAAKLLIFLGLDKQEPEGSGAPLISPQHRRRLASHAHYQQRGGASRKSGIPAAASGAALDYHSAADTSVTQQQQHHDRHEHHDVDDDGLYEETCYDKIRAFERRFVERYVRRAKVYPGGVTSSTYASRRASAHPRTAANPADLSVGGPRIEVEAEVPAADADGDGDAPANQRRSTAAAAGAPSSRSLARNGSHRGSATGAPRSSQRRSVLYSEAGYDQSSGDDDAAAEDDDGYDAALTHDGPPSRRPYEYSRLF